MAKKKRTTKHGKRTTKRAAAAQAKPRRRLTAAGLKKVSLEALRTELQRREDALVARREELLAEVEAIDSELGHVSPKRKAKKRVSRVGQTGRRKGGESLTAVLRRVLKGRTMDASQMIAAVKKAGYKSKSANFRNIVSQTLAKNPKLFKRVARGKYTAK